MRVIRVNEPSARVFGGGKQLSFISRFGTRMIILVLLSGCGVVPRVQNYQLTAEIEVDGKVYSGTTIQQLKCRKGLPLAWGMDVGSCRVRGEAVVVPVEGRGTVFILMGAANTSPTDGRVHLGSGEDMLADLNLVDGPRSPRKHGEWQVSQSKLPYMILFKDVRDRNTIEAVDPSNLQASLGTNASFKSLKVKTTSSKITFGKVRATLPWLPADESYLLNGQSTASYQDISLLGLTQTLSLESK